MIKQSFNPKVSIIIPVYNGSNYLAEAIDCALAQTYQNIEVLVVNDGSNDNGASEAIAKSYGDKIEYYIKTNGGVSSALNFGIQKMTGEWFTWLSHDDLYTPDRIKNAVTLLSEKLSKTEKLIIYSDGYMVNAEKKKIRNFRSRFKTDRIYACTEAAEIMAASGTLYGCSLLIPRGAFTEAGLFDENLRYSQDTYMWYKLFIHGYGICFSKEKDVIARFHKKQVSNTRKDLFVHDSMYIAQRLAPVFAKNPEWKNTYYHYLKRLLTLPCPEAIDFLMEYADENAVLSKKQLSLLHRERLLGKVKYNLKQTVKKLILR